MVFTHRDTQSVGMRFWIHDENPNATTTYPTDGQGGATTTGSSSELIGESKVLLCSLQIEGNTTATGGVSDVSLRNTADDTDLAFFHISRNYAGEDGLEFPGEGLEIDQPFGVRTNAGTLTLIVGYKKIATP